MLSLVAPKFLPLARFADERHHLLSEGAQWAFPDARTVAAVLQVPYPVRSAGAQAQWPGARPCSQQPATCGLAAWSSAGLSSNPFHH